MTRRTLLQRLDDSVRWTGIPAIAAGTPRRRPLRWTATIALALALGGYAATILQPRAASGGMVVLMLGFAIGCFMRMLGPLKPHGSIERVDEWDRAARGRSIEFTYLILSVTAPLGLILLGAWAQWHVWTMTMLSTAVTASGFLMMTIFAALPTAHASWTMRWQDEDQGQDEDRGQDQHQAG